MNVGLWQRLRHYSLQELVTAILRLPGRAVELLKLTAPDEVKLMDRIATMERDIILPIKVAGIAMLLYSFYFKRSWIGQKELGTLDVAVTATQYFLWSYIGFNAVVAGLLLAMGRVPLLLVQWAVFAMSLADGIFVSALVVVTGGYDSILYWLFLGLVVRGAVSVPRATSQILLNLTLTVCYVMAGSIDISINKALVEEARASAALHRTPTYARGSNAPSGRIRSSRGDRPVVPAPRATGQTALVRDARRSIALRWAGGSRVYASDEESAGHYQQCGVFAATGAHAWQADFAGADSYYPGRGRPLRPDYHANHGLCAVE
ncbi:MAG: hypothetical protein NT154_36445 [Verrucomicrobia bacterium]|nr:hypothetical protein [Verrucomicrobiota bacterium]